MIIKRLYNMPAWRWRNAFDELDRLRDLVDRFAEGFGRRIYREPSAGVFPLVNLTEDNDNYYIRAELPGIKADELDITATGNNLAIAGERKILVENEKAKYHRKEREAGKFNRMITLPGHIDSEKIKAKLVNGILTITMPKAEEDKPKKVTIN